MTVLNAVKSRLAILIAAFDPERRRQREDEAYLADATDPIDLEWRIRQLDQERDRRRDALSHTRFE